MPDRRLTYRYVEHARGAGGMKGSVAAHEAQAYKDDGTPEEKSRRTFLANATLAVGGVIGLVLTVPLAVSLIPESMVSPDKAGAGSWAPLPEDQFKKVAAGSDPVRSRLRSSIRTAIFRRRTTSNSYGASN